MPPGVAQTKGHKMAPYTESTNSREIFKEPSLISYHKEKSLKDILVKAKAWEL